MIAQPVRREEIIRAAVRKLRDEINLVNSYGGPDPNPSNTKDKQTQLNTLLWVLEKDNI
jgi:hypothetical protein